jgi:hypothetical protein
MVGAGSTMVIKHEKSKFGDINKTCVGYKDLMFTHKLDQYLEK